MFFYARNDDPKVFGIGLSRTGTTSLAKALAMLGYRTQHWRAPLDHRVLTLEDCFFCDAVTDINVSYAFESLACMFPNAKFVYTTRPVRNWARSISDHFRLSAPAGLRERLYHLPISPTGSGQAPPHTLLYHAILHALYTSHETWEDAYEAFDQRVRHYFSTCPERFLEMDVFREGHGWSELCAFLGKDIPDVEYPAVSMKSSATKKYIEEREQAET